jgi:hypothetical protein
MLEVPPFAMKDPERTEDKMRPLLKSGISRRGLLGSIVGAVLSAASFPYPGLARVLTTNEHPASFGAPTPADGNDPSFWSGEVAAKMPDNLVLTSMEGTRVVRILPGPTIWKEFDVAIDAVDIGDWVMAKGEPQPDGSLLAWAGWAFANIGVWHGTITALRAGGLVAKRHDGIDRALSFSRRLEVVTAARQLPVAAGTRALAVGMQIGSVGLVLPDRSLRATRIWIDNP